MPSAENLSERGAISSERRENEGEHGADLERSILVERGGANEQTSSLQGINSQALVPSIDFFFKQNIFTLNWGKMGSQAGRWRCGAV